MARSPSASTWTPKLTVIFNLLENFAFLTASSGDMIFFNDPVHAVSSPEHSMEILVAAIALLGVPVVFAGFMGILNRNEKLVRFYMYYLMVCLVIYAAYVVEMLFEFIPCNERKTRDRSEQQGKEGPCGHMRGLEISGLALAAGIHFLMAHPLYSFCEELKVEAGSTDKDLSEKVERKQVFKRLRQGPLSSIQGRLMGEYGSFFEATIGMSWNSNNVQLGPQQPHLPNMRLV
uniref:Uncharacterized protein n=1 Tax=Alexandrium catenella TaxID=2925 RepID=A0A7S1RWG3_ALECA